MKNLTCNSKESVEALSECGCRGAMIIVADLGIEDWASLGEILPGNFVRWIVSRKTSQASARREDLWAIWTCVTVGWKVADNTLQTFGDWELFERFLDGEDDVSQIEGEDGDEEGDGEGDEGSDV